MMEASVWINKIRQNPPDISIFQLIKNLKILLSLCRISKRARHNFEADNHFFLDLRSITILCLNDNQSI